MKKVLVIASREYRAAVRTKAFLLTLVLMPVLMGLSAGMQVLFKKLEDTKDKTYAVIDRSPDGRLAAFLVAEVEKYNEYATVDPSTKKAIASKFAIEVVPPGATPEAVVEQRLALSGRIEAGDLAGLLEIGSKVYDIRDDPFADPEKIDEAAVVRFQTKNPTQDTFRRFAERVVSAGVRQHRFIEQGISPEKIGRLQQPAVVRIKSLTKRDAVTGRVADASDSSQIVNLLLPGAMVAIMFMIIMIGAAPAMQGVVEEKAQRIAEVLLSSVSPFELMSGKLLGVVCVSLTMALVYLGGGYVVAANYGFASMLPLRLIVWFVVFLVLALLMYGSIFVAVGAAAADIKQTQSLLTPVMLLAALPFFALGPIMSDPNGPVATVMSFLPFSTPMIMMARESVPPGVPLWQLLLGIVEVLIASAVCVWIASRIFRVGILMSGKGPTFRDMIKWGIRG